MKMEIDVAEFAAQLKAGKGIGGKDGALAPLIKQLTEMTLQAEIETHLAQDLAKNRKNGTTSKTMKSSSGEFGLDVPRDRNGSFEPEIVKKNQTHMSDELEGKMLSPFALGNSYSQIADHIEDMYGVHFSKPAITAATDKLIPKLEEWRKRPLESVYSFVYLDAIHYIDGLKGFPEAINAVFPETEVQLCIVHQIRNSLKYVASKNQKEFAGELKKVYKAFTKEEAEIKLDKLEEKWGKKYPIVFNSWRNNWEHLTNYFKYSEDIRRIIYTTNIIESVHRQFRTLTKTKGAFPNDNSLLKLLYAGIMNAERKWTMPIRNWSLTISQLDIYFKERLKDKLSL